MKYWYNEHKEVEYRHFIEIKNSIEEQIFQSQNQNKNDKTSVGINDLEKLAKLRNEGIITEEEFQAEKRQILNI